MFKFFLGVAVGVAVRKVDASTLGKRLPHPITLKVVNTIDIVIWHLNEFANFIQKENER